VNPNDLPPRWRIRRTPTGRWEVHIRYTHPNPRWAAYVYVPINDWPTWDAALAYAARTQTNNYGRAA
jgi:hypothetical protein